MDENIADSDAAAGDSHHRVGGSYVVLDPRAQRPRADTSKLQCHTVRLGFGRQCGTGPVFLGALCRSGLHKVETSPAKEWKVRTIKVKFQSYSADVAVTKVHVWNGNIRIAAYEGMWQTGAEELTFTLQTPRSTLAGVLGLVLKWLPGSSL
jgi:hypothetical protein